MKTRLHFLEVIFFFFHQNGRTKPLVHKSHFLKSKYVALDKGELG